MIPKSNFLSGRGALESSKYFRTFWNMFSFFTVVSFFAIIESVGIVSILSVGVSAYKRLWEPKMYPTQVSLSLSALFAEL